MQDKRFRSTVITWRQTDITIPLVVMLTCAPKARERVKPRLINESVSFATISSSVTSIDKLPIKLYNFQLTSLYKHMCTRAPCSFYLPDRPFSSFTPRLYSLILFIFDTLMFTVLSLLCSGIEYISICTPDILYTLHYVASKSISLVK